MFDRARARVFAGTIAKKDVRGLLRTLSPGGVVAYSADQNFTYQNAFVPFFGIPAATLTATPDLARRGKAVVLPFWFHRDADGRYHLRIEPQWQRLAQRRSGGRRGASTCASWNRSCASIPSNTCGCIGASRRARRAKLDTALRPSCRRCT